MSRLILPPEELLRRGIYLAPYLVRGFPALIGIDSRNWAVKHFLIRPATSEEQAWQLMETWLDRFNPTLQLVRETPALPPRRQQREQIPAHLYEDQLTFALRLARRYAENHREYE